MLEYFALFVLLVTMLTLLVGVVLLGYLPGRIAQAGTIPRQTPSVSVAGSAC